MTDKITLGFIGTGKMGKPMVLRLLDAGQRVVVYNRTAAKLEELGAAGARIAGTPAEVTANADMVMLCLTDGIAVEQVVLGAQGIVNSAGEEKLVIDFSSISHQDTLRIAQELQQRSGMRWIDAPVSGGVRGAQQGKLVIMCGGEKADIDHARPVFALLSQRITHMGPSGCGQVTKLCNQVIVSCNLAVIAEAINLASNAGIDAERIPDALQGGWADSLPLQIYGPRMAAEHDEEKIGEIYTMLKDVRNALQFARSLDTPLPMTGAAEEIYNFVADKGYLHADAENLMRQFDKEDGD